MVHLSRIVACFLLIITLFVIVLPVGTAQALALKPWCKDMGGEQVGSTCTLPIGREATVGRSLDVSPGQTLVNYGTIHNNGTVGTSGTIRNYGVINNNSKINNNGTIYNYKEAAINNGTINNNGTIINCGLISSKINSYPPETTGCQ